MTRTQIAAPLLCLAAQLVWSLWPAPTGAGVLMPTAPAGARVHGLRTNAETFAAGGPPVVASDLGLTPGPLRLAPSELPAPLHITLAGYEPLDLTLRKPPGPNQPPTNLRPLVPVLVPALYMLRDYPFAAFGLLTLLGLWRNLARAGEDRRRRVQVRGREPRPGDYLEGYELLQKLGAGGMGQVFRARGEGEEVAVKVLHFSDYTDSARARFRREIEIVRKLRHPNLVFLYDWGEWEEHAFMVMELLPGETLEARLRCGPLTPEEAADVALQLVEAAQELERNGIVHRDLKPSNLMLSQGKVRLMDFGIASLSEAGARLTAPGGALGTPGFAAPEQIRGVGEADWRSDAYAIGAILYNCLSGVSPFPETTPAARMQAQLEGRFRALDDPLGSIACQLLAPDPALRGYATLEQVAGSLKDALRRCESCKN